MPKFGNVKAYGLKKALYIANPNLLSVKTVSSAEYDVYKLLGGSGSIKELESFKIQQRKNLTK